MGDREARTQAAVVSGHTGAAEDAASRRPARPDGTSVIVNRALSSTSTQGWHFCQTRVQRDPGERAIQAAALTRSAATRAGGRAALRSLCEVIALELADRRAK